MCIRDRFYSNGAYWGLIGDEDGDGSDLYFDIKSRSGAAGIAMSTGLTTNALLIENNGKADFSKSIEVGDEPSGASPTPGTIRWNGTDFEGYDGSNWKSLTKSFSTVATSKTITDIDGNTYETVKIGGQVWMSENLRVTKYNNGTPIENRPWPDDWRETQTSQIPAWVWYDNDSRYDKVIGKLYNFYAVESGNICPIGWHVPTETEMMELIDFADNDDFTSTPSNRTLNSTGYPPELNESGRWDGVNYTGFTLRPGGWRDNNATFNSKGSGAFLWTSTSTSANSAKFVESSITSISIGGFQKNEGLGIRCIEDD